MGYVLINVVKTEHLGLLMPVQTWSKAWPKQIIIILALLFGTDLHIMSVLSLCVCAVTNLRWVLRADVTIHTVTFVSWRKEKRKREPLQGAWAEARLFVIIFFDKKGELQLPNEYKYLYLALI